MDQRRGWVKRALGRLVPVDGWPTTPPDHRAYIRADYSMCCEYHERTFYMRELKVLYAEDDPLRWLGR
jgi:hypothetical protein